MEITSKAKTFAQEGNRYILTNHQDATFEKFFETRATGCLVDFDERKVSPELPIMVLTRHSPYRDTPDRQVKPEEAKDFYQSKQIKSTVYEDVHTDYRRESMRLNMPMQSNMAEEICEC